MTTDPPDLRTLAADAIPYKLISTPAVGIGSARRLKLADAVLSAVLPAHRAMVLAEAVQAIEDITGSLVCDWTKGEALASIQDLAVADLDAAEENPVTLRARSCPTCHSTGEPYVIDRTLGSNEPIRCKNLWHIEVREPERGAQDCGHDLDAFQRQAEELARLRERLDVAQTAYLAQADELAATIRRYEPVIEAAKVLAVTAWKSTAPRTAVFEAFLAAVAALGDAPDPDGSSTADPTSPTDTESGQRGRDEDARCSKCGNPLTPCVTCGKPAGCGDSWCADCVPAEPAGTETADDLTEIDTTEADLDRMMAEGEPVEVVGPAQTFATSDPINRAWPPSGYLCFVRGKDCPGHPSKWMTCEPAGSGTDQTGEPDADLR